MDGKGAGFDSCGATRQESIKIVQKGFLKLNQGLPELNEKIRLIRSREAILKRAAALHAILTATADYKSRLAACNSWVEENGVYEFLSQQEKMFLAKPSGYNARVLSERAEAQYALLYILGFYDTFNFFTQCPDDVALKMPRISSGESLDKKIEEVALLEEESIRVYLDALNLTWYSFSINPDLRHLGAFAIIQRRVAFSWVCSDRDWDSFY